MPSFVPLNQNTTFVFQHNFKINTKSVLAYIHVSQSNTL